MRQSVGVDFGTSTTLIAEGAAAGRPAIVPIGRTTSWMPSVAIPAASSVLQSGASHAAKSSSLALMALWS